MKRLFLDTNIIIDLLADRLPYSSIARQLLVLAENKQVKLYTSSHSIATAYYLVKKYSDEQSLRRAITILIEIVTVIPVDADVIQKSLRAGQKDFEDSIQIFCACTIDNIFAIITRNLKDFKSSAVPAYAPDALLQILGKA